MKKLFALFLLILSFLGVGAKEITDAGVDFSQYTDISQVKFYGWGCSESAKERLSIQNGCLHFHSTEAVAPFGDCEFHPIGGVAAKVGVTYTLHYKIKGTLEQGITIIGFGQTFNGRLPVTTEWQEGTVDIECTSTSGDILMQCGDYVGDFDIAYLRITHDDKEEIVFESKFAGANMPAEGSGWLCYNNNYPLEPGSVRNGTTGMLERNFHTKMQTAAFFRECGSNKDATHRIEYGNGNGVDNGLEIAYGNYEIVYYAGTWNDVNGNQEKTSKVFFDIVDANSGVVVFHSEHINIADFMNGGALNGQADEVVENVTIPTGNYILKAWGTTNTVWGGLTIAKKGGDEILSGGVMYTITSRTDCTIEAVGVSNNKIASLTLPAEVEYAGTSYKVATIASEAFADCPNLLEAIFEDVIDIPANVFSDVATETNLIIHAPKGSTSEYKGNVVIDGVAENIVLHDGKPLRISQEFTANRVSYSREFSKATYIGESGGWETLALPFDVQRIESERCGVLMPFHTGQENDKHFWLAGLTQNGFGRASAIYANIPYIISMPNNAEYDPSYNITGRVTFSAENARLYKTQDAATYTGSEFSIVPTYENVPADASVYAINDSEAYGYHAGALFAGGMRGVRPFEAYVVDKENGARPQYYVIDGSGTVGIEEIMTQADSHITTYDISGRRVDAQSRGIVIQKNSNGSYSKKYNK